MALALALGSASRNIVIAHVVHDLRPADEALADRDTVRSLAERLQLEFAETSIVVRRGQVDGASADDRNLEARARRLRYSALARLAQIRSIRFIATAHHADDQLETMLMALARGAGPRGLSGMRSRRPLPSARSQSDRLYLIRPMLPAGLTREECRSICTAAGVQWREDATNADTTRLRAAIRHQVVPVLAAIRPGVARRAASAADILAEADRALRRRAVAVIRNAEEHGMFADLDIAAGSLVLNRRALHQPEAVLGQVLIIATERVCRDAGRPVRRDALVARTLAPLIRAIRDGSGERREFALAGVRVQLTAELVTFSAPLVLPND